MCATAGSGARSGSTPLVSAAVDASVCVFRGRGRSDFSSANDLHLQGKTNLPYGRRADLVSLAEARTPWLIDPDWGTPQNIESS